MADTYGTRYIFGNLVQNNLYCSIRMDWTFTPKLSLQTYLQPYISVGAYSDFKELAREYSNPLFFSVHRLTVDAYAVQHPGSTDRQSIQSVGVHLIRLCLFLEHGLAAEKANDAMLEAAKYKNTFTWLKPPTSMGAITAADVFKARSVDEHKAVVRAWAENAWNAWLMHHDTIRSWLPAQQKAAADSYRRR